MRKRFIVACVASAWATAGVAQDAMFQNLGGDFALLGVQHRAMESAIGIDSARSGPRSSLRSVAYPPVRSGVRAPAFPYASTPASRRAAATGLVTRTARNNPTFAKSLAAEMTKHDFFRIYPTLIANTPYRANDAADTLAAYLVLGYIIVNGGDSTAPQERAVRAQVALRAASNPSFTPGKRTQLAEDLKLLWVTLHGGWQTARRQGSQRQYASDVAKLFQASNINLRALRLTDQGFVAR